MNFDKFYGAAHDTLQFSCLMAQTNKEVFILTPKLKNEIGYSPLLQAGRVVLRNNKKYFLIKIYIQTNTSLEETKELDVCK